MHNVLHQYSDSDEEYGEMDKVKKYNKVCPNHHEVHLEPLLSAHSNAKLCERRGSMFCCDEICHKFYCIEVFYFSPKDCTTM